MQRFTDQVIIVSGAAGGIGKATALRIASEGGKVVCTDIQAEAVETTAMNATLTESDLTKWMKAINGIRLVLGTQLDVSEETIAPGDDDPSAPTFALYEYLGYLTENIVQVLTTH